MAAAETVDSVRHELAYLFSTSAAELQFQYPAVVLALLLKIGNESVPIQLTQCWFPGLAISNAEM